MTAKTLFECSLATLLGLLFPPLLIAFTVLWLARRFTNPYVVATLSTCLAFLLGTLSRRVLELVILVGAFALSPLSLAFDHNYRREVSRLREVA